MSSDRDICDCEARPIHGPEHFSCCRCVWCDECNNFVKSKLYSVHVAKPHQRLRSDWDDVVPDEPAQDDSLSQALADISLEDRKYFNGDFRREARKCIQDLVEHLEEFGGPMVCDDRAAAWRHVIQVLISDDDVNEKVALLLELYDDGDKDLEANIAAIIMHAEQLFPSHKKT